MERRFYILLTLFVFSEQNEGTNDVSIKVICIKHIRLISKREEIL